MSNEFDELITQGQRGLVLITDEEFICEALWFTEGFVLLLTGDLGAFLFWWIPKKELLKEILKQKVFYLYLEYNEVIWETLLKLKLHSCTQW